MYDCTIESIVSTAAIRLARETFIAKQGSDDQGPAWHESLFVLGVRTRLGFFRPWWCSTEERGTESERFSRRAQQVAPHSGVTPAHSKGTPIVVADGAAQEGQLSPY